MKKTSEIINRKELENVITSNDTLDKYLKYCYSLKFSETPNYNKLKTILQHSGISNITKYNSQLT